MHPGSCRDVERHVPPYFVCRHMISILAWETVVPNAPTRSHAHSHRPLQPSRKSRCNARIVSVEHSPQRMCLLLLRPYPVGIPCPCLPPLFLPLLYMKPGTRYLMPGMLYYVITIPSREEVNCMPYRHHLLCFLFYFIIFALLFLLPPGRKSAPGPHSRLSSTLPPHYSHTKHSSLPITIYYIVFSLLFSLLSYNSRNSDPGSQTRLFSLLPAAVLALHLSVALSVVVRGHLEHRATLLPSTPP